MVNGTVGTYRCIKKNGTKYYWDNNSKKVFSVINGKKIEQNGISKDEFDNNKNAINYFKEAKGCFLCGRISFRCTEKSLQGKRNTNGIFLYSYV